MKQVHLKPVPTEAAPIPMQPASADIWDKKYRLKDKQGTPVDQDIDATYKRVAKALAEVEQTPEAREEWYEKFLWALRHGAIPAGRIISNAGALAHKPATSTINCTVSGTIHDSMNDILEKVHEAGLTLKAGCVSADTRVVTERGRVTARQAFEERHTDMLCYDRASGAFEMRTIERHMTTLVPRAENIGIRSDGAVLQTSIRHPVLVYRDGSALYVRADEVRVSDALIHYPLSSSSTGGQALEAWFSVGDGSAYRDCPKHSARTAHAKAQGQRLIFKVRAEQREYDQYVMPVALQQALARENPGLSHLERQRLGFYHGVHQAQVVSHVWLDRWEERFPRLATLIAFARTLRPVEGIERNLELGETFYDFTVEKHHNYLAGIGGLMVIHNCGIGYEFSTLRPKGAYVSGAGAYTSGPLSFMDIYDKMCFTVSSAGGRRGAQMATFDVGHPDVMDFIRAKRESGRLRQFNLSLLITRDFMQAVRHDRPWQLAFPIIAKEAEHESVDLRDPERVVWRDWPAHDGYIVNEAGKVACKVYRTLPARRLWDVIMGSTYDYAEPGFILIDKVNEMNNNWYCEEIRATNPCVTADTRLHTQHGLVPIGELYASGAELEVTVDNRALNQGKGVTTRGAVPAFMTTHQADVYRVETEDGYEIKATAWHDFYTQRGKVKLDELRAGDALLIQSGKGQFGKQGNEQLGELLGLITADGHFTNRGKGKEAAFVNFWGRDCVLAPKIASYVNSLIADLSLNARTYRVSPVAVPERNHMFIRSIILTRVLEHYGFTRESKLRVPEVVWRGTENCVKGYLRGLFQADGTVNISSASESCSIRLASSYPEMLKDVQMLLANFGVFCRFRKRRDAGSRLLPDGEGGQQEYQCRANYELIVDGESREQFMQEIGFLLEYKTSRYGEWVKDKVLKKTQRFASKLKSITHVGKEAVYDTTQSDNNAVIFNGLVTGQCGEQPLPPFGSCLLGSINLTRFVRHPFTERAEFDWKEFRGVVAVFTRLLDNVVEINGLPLPQQRDEITRKRRHGMGYLGLGSTLTMLRMKYGDENSLAFTEQVTKEMALTGWWAGVKLAKEKGPAPIMEEEFPITTEMLSKRPEMLEDGLKVGDMVKGKVLMARYGRYMANVAKADAELVTAITEHGTRFTHHTSIAPTGTISLSLANNASNGIEPSFAHHYSRNVIREGKKSKEKVEVYSYELLAYRELINPEAMPFGEDEDTRLPDYFITAEDIDPKQHVDVQAAAQRWIDSSISKTANVPTDYPYEDFKDIYTYAYSQGLKGCTTFRFNPEAFQGVLVKEQDLENTTYRFVLEDGSTVEAKGNEDIEYDGEIHSAANLYDALKEGYYGKF